jgi:hypothetical protein
MIGDGSNKKSMTYVKNIVDFITFLAKNPAGYQVFNYVDKPDLSIRELIGCIEASLDVSVPSFRIPYWLGLAGGYTFDALAKLTGRTCPPTGGSGLFPPCALKSSVPPRNSMLPKHMRRPFLLLIPWMGPSSVRYAMSLGMRGSLLSIARELIPALRMSPRCL